MFGCILNKQDTETLTMNGTTLDPTQYIKFLIKYTNIRVKQVTLYLRHVCEVVASIFFMLFQFRKCYVQVFILILSFYEILAALLLL